ncbi:MAG: ATP synthase subunit I [Synechococcales cyanobacterium RM1_1_8]|nr:ATP synthase subunit I [Synechococcales cyanobacterium RM1_1_8]
MDEFYALRRELLFTTLAFTAVAFASVLAYYGSSVALSYLFGAAVGLYYLRMLAKSVEQLTSQKGLGKSRIALVAILVILAARWDQIQILPAFLGFLTYKLALIYYTLRITLLR